MSTEVQFRICPDVSLVDAPVTIELVGLLPKQNVTIRARRTSKSPGVSLESYGVFQSDDHGVVNLSTQAPLAGTYSEVDGMGLFWSMNRIDTPESAGNSTPLALLLFTFTAECDGAVVAARTIERQWLSSDVQRTPVRENGLVATFFHHVEDRPLPGIIVLGGSDGGLNESVAAIIACHGYATLALAYFGIEHLPKELVNIPLEYVETAINWFAAQPGVRGDWIGVQGTSKGGELALLAASMFPQIKAVVCVSSGGVVLHGIQAKGAEKLPPSWMYRGQPIPYASEENPYDTGKLARPDSNVITYRPWYDAHIADEDVLEKATIPVERIQGGILFFTGADDQMINSERLSQISMERLKKFNHPYCYEHHNYPEVGHTIWIPYLLSNTRAEVPNIGKVWVFGGTLSANARASVHSWNRMLDFFDKESSNALGT